MKKTLRWFTLVELLVVITILAIISVVAYQNFGGAVDKAVSGRKINDVSTIETALQQFKVDNNFYPATDVYNASTNMWWYNSWSTSTPSNTITVTYNGQEVNTIASANGGWKIIWVNTYSAKQIGAKWTISQATLGKRYLTKDLYDPEVGDVKVGWTATMIESWVGRYVYATFKKAPDATDWTQNYNGTAYNIAFTIKKEWSDTFLTKIVGDYDEESCFDNKNDCPSNLIGLEDSSTQTWATNISNYGIPYWVTDFAQ